MYGKRPVSEDLMPYGELALISFLESKLQPNIDKTASLEDSRLFGSSNLRGRKLQLSSYFEDPFPWGDAYLQVYLKKAQKEGDLEHVVRALTSLGDYNQLFGRYSAAKPYYELAWLAAQELGESQKDVVDFSVPTALPAFKYAYPREKIMLDREMVSVKLLLSISDEGRVIDVEQADPEDGLKKYFPRARRGVRRVVFRPRMIDAATVPSEKVEHITRVPLRK
jgi:hypothetical protein